MKFSKAEVDAIIEASPRTFVPFNKLFLSNDHQARSGGTVSALILADRISPRYAAEAGHCQSCAFRSQCEGAGRQQRS